MKFVKLLIFLSIVVLGCKTRPAAEPKPDLKADKIEAVDSSWSQAGVLDSARPDMETVPNEHGLKLESARVPFSGKFLPDDPPDFKPGIAAYSADNFKVAAELLTRASRKQPLDWQIWFYLGVSEYFAGNGKAAVHALSTVDKLGPPPSHQLKSRWYLANAYLLEKNPQRAERILNSIVAQNKDYKLEAMALHEEVLKMPKSIAKSGE